MKTTNNKTCPKCQVEYPATIEYFNRNKNTIDGLFGWCKKCKKESDHKYHWEHIDEINKQRKEWRKKHKEVTAAKDRLYRKKMKGRKQEEIVIPCAKKCSRCGKTKALNEFFKDITIKDGLYVYCKECTKNKNKKSYQKHKDTRKMSGKIYRDRNKEKIFKRQQIYYQENKERIRVYKKEYQQKNRKAIAKRLKKWSQTHRKEIALYCKNRRNNDLNYKILCNLRSRLSAAISSQGAHKSNRTMDLIGCSIVELKTHIQKQFGDGMTWENYGLGNKKWSIDHIIPCAYFDLTKIEEQKKCFHHTNLQPLWNKRNCEKNSLYNGKYIRKRRESYV